MPLIYVIDDDKETLGVMKACLQKKIEVSTSNNSYLLSVNEQKFEEASCIKNMTGALFYR